MGSEPRVIIERSEPIIASPIGKGEGGASLHTRAFLGIEVVLAHTRQ